MERGCVTYSVLFIAGILAAGIFTPGFFSPSLLLAILLALCIATKRNSTLFLVLSHSAIFIAGINAFTLAGRENLPPQGNLKKLVINQAGKAQHKVSGYLYRFVPEEEAHATLSALTIGTKDEIGADLKKSYSKAGAMHILALSGLHVGIIFSIMDKLLSPMLLLPGGNVFRMMVSILILAAYIIISGCSPSVIRAGTMIVIYKMGVFKCRSISNWDSIAISAIAIGVIAPMQVGSIGFQLSYAAVIGIAALYPACRSAFRQMFRYNGTYGTIICRIAYFIWESISISICCQIATLPLLILYFGESAQYFILTNLIAVPAVTCILHLFAASLLLQWLPFANDWITHCLNYSIDFLNNYICFISN